MEKKYISQKLNDYKLVFRHILRDRSGSQAGMDENKCK